jgi:hypothetical protein
MRSLTSCRPFALLACSLLVWAGAPVCQPSDCFDGSCDGKEVGIEKFELTLDKWNSSIKNYTHVGSYDSHALKVWFLIITLLTLI